MTKFWALILCGSCLVLSVGQLDLVSAAENPPDEISNSRFEALSKASAEGSVTAMVKLAGVYLSGAAGTRDPARAADLYRRAAALGDADAIFHLGNMYLLGDGVEQDEEQAFRLFEKAAGQGHPLAIQNYESLKRVVAPAEVADVPGNELSASSLDEMQAIRIARRHGMRIDFAGTEDPTASDQSLAEPGEPIVEDPQAKPLIESNPVIAEEDFFIAEQLYYGDGVPKDEGKAISLYRRAARAGHEQAKTRLLAIYAAAGIDPPRCENNEANDEICF